LRFRAGLPHQSAAGRTAIPAFVREANQLLPASDSTVQQIRALEHLASGGQRR